MSQMSQCDSKAWIPPSCYTWVAWRLIWQREMQGPESWVCTREVPWALGVEAPVFSILISQTSFSRMSEKGFSGSKGFHFSWVILSTLSFKYHSSAFLGISCLSSDLWTELLAYLASHLVCPTEGHLCPSQWFLSRPPFSSHCFCRILTLAALFYKCV